MILVSACLVGLNTKYNGGNNYNRFQIGMGSKYRPFVGKWRVNPKTIIN